MFICNICGSTHVKCAAVVDPNTKQFIDFGYRAFSDGENIQCGNVPLTDPDEVKADIDKIWAEHVAKHGQSPRYAYCEIVELDYEGNKFHYIRIGKQREPEPANRVFAACADKESLKALTVPNLESGREFTVISIEALAAKLP